MKNNKNEILSDQEVMDRQKIKIWICWRIVVVVVKWFHKTETFYKNWQKKNEETVNGEIKKRNGIVTKDKGVENERKQNWESYSLMVK